jgi:hypothetical protein
MRATITVCPACVGTGWKLHRQYVPAEKRWRLINQTMCPMCWARGQVIRKGDEISVDLRSTTRMKKKPMGGN